MIHRIHVTSFGIGCPHKIQVETIRNPKARNQKGVGIASLGFPFFEFEWIDWDLAKNSFFLDSCCPHVSNESEYATYEAAPWTLNHDWLCLRVGRHRKSLQQCWATRFNQMAGHILFCSSAINLTIHSVRKFPYQGFSKGFSISPFRFFFNRTPSTQPSYYHPMFPSCSMCTNHGKTM